VLSLIGIILEEGGYEPVLRETPEDLHSIIEGIDRPDLVISDLHLARRSGGIELLKKFKEYPDTQEIPLIICTGDLTFIRDEAPELGLPTIQKPFDIDEFLAVVKAHLPVASTT
jgi:CheY-like chemotaxis protein